MLRTLAKVVFASIFAVTAVFSFFVVEGCGASCKAQEVNGVNMNCSGGAAGYMWTGTSCIYTHACNCTGADCQRLYATQDACDNAHLHCTPGAK